MESTASQTSSRTLSKGDVHLILAGIFFGTYILVRFTDPADYGLTLHPKLDKVWSMWRIVITAGWLLLALLAVTFRRREAQVRSLSYAAASATALALVILSVFFPQSSSWPAILGSVLVYVATSAVLCVKIQRPIPAALLGALFLILQILVDGFVHFMTGAFRIH